MGAVLSVAVSAHGRVILSECLATACLAEPLFVPIVRAMPDGGAIQSSADVFLDRADKLFSAGFFREAGATCRIALERLVLTAAIRAGGKSSSVCEMLAALAHAGIISAEARGRLRRLHGVGNNCAHGNKCRIPDVLELIACVRELSGALPR